MNETVKLFIKNWVLSSIPEDEMSLKAVEFEAKIQLPENLKCF